MLNLDAGGKKLQRIRSSSGFSAKFECKAFPTLSTMADVVMDDSMHSIAVTASNRVTSFLNISLACAATLTGISKYGQGHNEELMLWWDLYLEQVVSNSPAYVQWSLLQYKVVEI